MALYAFNVVTVEEADDFPTRKLIVDHPGAMVEAENPDEALGKATRIADRLAPSNDFKFRHVNVWPATLVAEPDDPALRLRKGGD